MPHHFFASAFSIASHRSGYASLTACSKRSRASVLNEYRIVVSCFYRSTAATLGKKTVIFGDFWVGWDGSVLAGDLGERFATLKFGYCGYLECSVVAPLRPFHVLPSMS